MTNIVCETAASMSVFLKLPPPKREQQDCEKNTGLLICRIASLNQNS